MVKPKIIVVDGLVGSGKTSLIHKVLVPYLIDQGKQVIVVNEPVKQWQESGLFDLFYTDMKRWAYHFQTEAFRTRIMACQESYKRYGDDIDVYILERSIFSDPLFVNILYEDGMMNDIEYRSYTDWCALWTQLMPFKPTLFIYLRPSIDVCMHRVAIRNRCDSEKSGVTATYQEKLFKEHERLFGKDAVEIDRGVYIPCLNITTNIDFLTCDITKKWMCETINDRIK